MSTPQPPSADQLAAARLAHWRQNTAEGADGSTTALLTVEAARQFVSSCGLLLFAPRPQHINSPAPTFVEATLGRPEAAPTLADTAAARTLLARLIAEGSAVPLNLLGAPSTTPDAPDFIASAATFSYVFTLRGDKAFKQPPSTSGATKVSPLALNTYTLLVENGPTSAYDLATQLGKEITEAAVLRALAELWQHLRVLPVPDPNGGATVWETIANRFTKQLKAGANAGQPSALSALISLYLSQSLLATETDIETFLSPLAPRSRVRDVLHALSGARQLESIAVDGKTNLHIHGELPTFSNPAATADTSAEPADDASPAVEFAEDGSRIRKFVPKPRKVGTGYIERAKPFGNASRSSAPREAGPGRPYRKPAGEGRRDSPVRPSFNKPWEEERQQRADRAAAGAAPSADAEFQDIDLVAAASPISTPPTDTRPARRSYPAKSGFGGGGSRPSFPRKPGFGGDRPAFTRKPGFAAGDRPEFSRNRDGDSDARPPRRDFAPREGGDTRPPRRDFAPREGGDSRPPRRESFGASKPFGDRKPFGKPGFGDRKREGFSPRPGAGGDRPSFGARPSFGDRPSSGDRERRPFRRDDSSGEGRPPRREFAPRSEGASRPPREGFSGPRPFRDRSGDEAQGAAGRPDRPAFRKFDAPRGPRKPFTPREGGGTEARPPRGDFSGPRKPFVRAEGGPPREGGGGYAGKREGSGYAGKREGSGYAGKREGSGLAGKKPFGAKPGFGGKKPFAARPSGPRGADAPGASTFDKFKGGNKPWGKRPPGRKPKPEQDEA